MTAAVSLDRIGHIAVNVKDVERATRFYRDTLGLRLLFTVPKGTDVRVKVGDRVVGGVTVVGLLR